SLPEPARMREYMKRLSARPHHTGSAYDKDNAEWILARFKEWGWEAKIETFDVLFPTPRERVVEMVEPTKFSAQLQEPAVATDPTSNQQDEQLPTYNAYSIDGDVTAPLVYVNYGIPSDYDQLERMGISVNGCIVIARYGASWRGIKPKVAAEHGAVGCLIYSDPRGDGYYDGEVFPEGPWRPEDGVQRGSVVDMPYYPGDPLTPGVGATAEAKRLPLNEVKVLTKIPVLPISYGDAKPLLAALRGIVAPEGWRGALPITYHIGPGATKVHLKVLSNWGRKTIYDVVARIQGSTYPDEWVIRGNHHDAWVNGAEDPSSGQMCVLEEARVFGALLKQGWKPKRTIFYCAWDAEEQGLLGSTEWVEAHADELKQHATVYFNSDSNERGFLNMGGSHSLEKFINGVARDIEDPETGLSAWKRSQLQQISRTALIDRGKLRSSQDLPIGALGSGSDFTPFLSHLGVATLNLGYGGEDGGGVYHSIYDDFYWYTHFSDTSFVYGRAAAQTFGTAVMRFSDAELLPFDFTNLAETIRKYVDELKLLLDTKRKETIEQNTQIQEGLFAAIADPRERSVPPSIEAVPPYLNFAPLDNAYDTLSRSAGRYQKAAAKFIESKRSLLKGVNAKLIQSERMLTSADGLPNRSWYKHQIYAPGFYTGYGVKTIPAVREAMEQKQWKDAEVQIAKVGDVLKGMAGHLESIAADLEQAVK
ncbi:MAG TPA: folate hydrolase, partial [Bacteroidetes bacterium]|nr:folate hydrolase [Bacteroidota bacterium]